MDETISRILKEVSQELEIPEVESEYIYKAAFKYLAEGVKDKNLPKIYIPKIGTLDPEPARVKEHLCKLWVRYSRGDATKSEVLDNFHFLDTIEDLDKDKLSRARNKEEKKRKTFYNEKYMGFPYVKKKITELYNKNNK